MAELKESSLSDPARALDEEDEATLAAIDRGSRAAAEGRTAPMEEAPAAVERSSLGLGNVLVQQEARLCTEVRGGCSGVQ
jgi:hypothetical protein